MVKNIVKDQKFLMIKSTEATKEDLSIATDLIDTLTFNKARCVGMAANMIGISKRVIIFEDENKKYVVMFNPVIIKKTDPYETKEGCLSLTGVRDCIRHKNIKVEYFDINFVKKIKTYTNFQAEIIEHECDHLDGIII